MNRRRMPDRAWPLGIAILLAASMATSLSVVFWAHSDGGPQVVENYYHRAVHWDSTAAAIQRLPEMGWQIELEWRDARLAVAFRDADGARRSVQELEVAAYRPARAAAVHTWQPIAGEDGQYELETGLLTPGIWDFVVRGSVSGAPFEATVRRTIGDPGGTG